MKSVTLAVLMVALVALVAALQGCDQTITDATDDGAATIYVEHLDGCYYRLSLVWVGDYDPALVTWLVDGVEIGNGNPVVYEFPGNGYYTIRVTWYTDGDEWMETSVGRRIECETEDDE